VAQATLTVRLNQGAWTSLPMTLSGGDRYGAAIAGVPANTQVDYYVQAVDGLGLDSVNPAGAPNDFYTLYVTELAYAYDAEDPAAPGWQLGVFGDTATQGIWLRADPVGTQSAGIQIQTEDDHTPAPGIKCFVTGNGNPGDNANAADVDGGCTTLRSPVFNVSGADLALLSYWRWYSTIGITADDEFAVDVSADGGYTWTPDLRHQRPARVRSRIGCPCSGRACAALGRPRSAGPARQLRRVFCPAGSGRTGALAARRLDPLSGGRYFRSSILRLKVEAPIWMRAK